MKQEKEADKSRTSECHNKQISETKTPEYKKNKTQKIARKRSHQLKDTDTNKRTHQQTQTHIPEHPQKQQQP